jgi:hypothetical protein
VNEIRPLLHELLNALAISRGLCEAVQMSLKGEIALTDEQKLDKLTRSIKAMDRIEGACRDVRKMVVQD